MNIVGLTGGIGSGKSLLGTMFQSLGYAVYNADQAAKRLMNEDEELKTKIISLFGDKAYTKDGMLNRPYIANIVFNNQDRLQELNKIVHPATREDFKSWVSNYEQDYPFSFVLREAAILFESGSSRDASAIISVYAPKSLRIHRVCKRDGVKEDAVLARMSKQWSEWEKIRRVDWVIYNDEKHMLIPQLRSCMHYLNHKFSQGNRTPE